MRLLLVGNPQSFHIGNHFACAARSLGWELEIADPRRAYGQGLWQKVLWRIDRLPAAISSFEKEVVEATLRFRPELVLTTGTTPLRDLTLSKLRTLGARLINFSTDDPWNIHHRAKWHLAALPHYDHIFSPRKANLEDFATLCSPSTRVSSLHFGYNPQVHFVETAVAPSSGCDVLIVGGADNDRVPYAQALIADGLSVTAYGGYWERFRIKGLIHLGHADSEKLRIETRRAKVNLILVRRANRDGHVMRSYEAWACGGCLLVEDTPDHQQIFGPEGKSVLYFTTPDEAADQAKRLVASRSLRVNLLEKLANSPSFHLHTYADRLKVIERVAQQLQAVHIEPHQE